MSSAVILDWNFDHRVSSLEQNLPLRSSRLNEFLLEASREATTSVITLEEDSKHAVEAMLEYMYGLEYPSEHLNNAFSSGFCMHVEATNHSPDDEGWGLWLLELFVELHELGDRYNLPGLM